MIRTVALLCCLAALPARAEVTFRHALDDKPLAVPLPEGDKLTEAVRTFHQSGEDPYIGKAEALSEGKAVYDEWCQACHKPDGSGGMGPSFLDNDWNNSRASTALGKFEIIWGGASGAMQPFKDRLTQDQILKVIAHIEDLRAKAGVGQEMATEPQ